jgi:DNA-binding Lrp family transcriptional regulator
MVYPIHGFYVNSGSNQVQREICSLFPVDAQEDSDMNGFLKLDRIDINILVQLQKDGRISNVNLADAVGLSPSPCLQRVKRLESAGYITGYEAHVNLPKITDSVTVFTEVTLQGHRREEFSRFENCIREYDELIECHLITGGYDYLLRFITRSIEHYQEVIESLLDKNIGIDKYFSYIVIKSPIIKSSVPLRTLLTQQMQNTN